MCCCDAGHIIIPVLVFHASQFISIIYGLITYYYNGRTLNYLFTLFLIKRNKMFEKRLAKTQNSGRLTPLNQHLFGICNISYIGIIWWYISFVFTLDLGECFRKWTVEDFVASCLPIKLIGIKLSKIVYTWLGSFRLRLIHIQFNFVVIVDCMSLLLIWQFDRMQQYYIWLYLDKLFHKHMYFFN